MSQFSPTCGECEGRKEKRENADSDRTTKANFIRAAAAAAAARKKGEANLFIDARVQTKKSEKERERVVIDCQRTLNALIPVQRVKVFAEVVALRRNQ